jgi:hypothetical protein
VVGNADLFQILFEINSIFFYLYCFLESHFVAKNEPYVLRALWRQFLTPLPPLPTDKLCG